MHLQRQRDEHSGCGNGGASSLRKRLSRSASIAGHAMGPARTLTACHGCLRGPGSFGFVTICGSSFAICDYDSESAMVSISLAIFSHQHSQNHPRQRFWCSCRLSHWTHSCNRSISHGNCSTPESIRGSASLARGVKGHLASGSASVGPPLACPSS